MTPEERAEIVGALAPPIQKAINQQIDELRNELAPTIDELNQAVDHLFRLTVQTAAEQTDGMFGGEMTDAYRRFVVQEAARLKVRASEVRKATDEA